MRGWTFGTPPTTSQTCTIGHMRQWYMAIVLLAGCGFQHGITADDARRDDAPSSPDAPADGDTPPIDAASDAMVDAPPTPVDTDGDGEPDATDNCPMAPNADQRDHDGDAHGDVCDHCPHLASATDPDGDGDGVGDACDPRPMTAGDSIALFEGFYDANSIANWTERGNGTWTVANGVLTQSSSTVSSTTNELIAPVNLPRSSVTAGFHVIALGNGSGTQSPHVSVASGVANNQSYWCSVVDEGNDDQIYATIIRPMMFPDLPHEDWPGTFAPGSDLQATSTLLGGTNTCTVVQGAITADVSGSIGPAGGAVEVATRSASASFDYVFVVKIGP